MTTTYLSEVPLPERGVIVFDLDDTLYQERDFVLSGFRAVSERIGRGSYARLVELFDAGERDAVGLTLVEAGCTTDKDELITLMREHPPEIQLADGARRLLERLRQAGHPLGLLTDGRSVTQRNKIAALDVAGFFDEVVISEEFQSAKPAERNYIRFEERFPHREYVYVADNLAKDFVTPNRRGWTTVCLLDKGWNIHPQRFHETPSEYLPQHCIHDLE